MSGIIIKINMTGEHKPSFEEMGMNPLNERFYSPQVGKDKIGAERHVPEDVRAKRKERRERAESISSYMLRWWRGDAHTHSKISTREGFGYSEGIYDMEEIMEYYKSLQLEFVCFSEHSSKPGSPEILTIDSPISRSILTQAEKITHINRERGGDIGALSSIEANIMFDAQGEPRLDLPQEVVEKLDIVLASRHGIAREKEPAAIKASLLAAIRNPSVDVIGHPDRYTRKDNETSPEYWQEYWGIWPEILQEMADRNVAFEININSQPSHELIKKAVEHNVKFFINYDAHDFNQFKKEQTDTSVAGEDAKNKWATEVATVEDLENLRRYKEDRLSAGPGVIAILQLYRWIKTLESLGVTEQQVVNSSKENLLTFLVREKGKNTENLRFLMQSEESQP
jgi:histidinol phosphatase-like PHP family hydrolase